MEIPDKKPVHQHIKRNSLLKLAKKLNITLRFVKSGRTFVYIPTDDGEIKANTYSQAYNILYGRLRRMERKPVQSEGVNRA